MNKLGNKCTSFVLSAIATLLMLTTHARAIEITHHYPYSSTEDSYEVQLIILALEATKDLYDDEYSLRPSANLTHARAIEQMKNKSYPNFVRAFAYDDDSAKDGKLKYIPYPINRGSFGFRVCFRSPKLMYNIQSRDDLLKYSHGQGIAWLDSKILRYNGFKVHEGPMTSLAKMVVYGRFDFYCRGITEVEGEYESLVKAGLELDQSFYIYYPLPIFLYTHRDNSELFERLSLGIDRSLKNGTAVALWEKYFQDKFEFVNLRQRRAFELLNPYVKNVNPIYKEHIHRVD